MTPAAEARATVLRVNAESLNSAFPAWPEFSLSALTYGPLITHARSISTNGCGATPTTTVAAAQMSTAAVRA